MALARGKFRNEYEQSPSLISAFATLYSCAASGLPSASAPAVPATDAAHCRRVTIKSPPIPLQAIAFDTDQSILRPAAKARRGFLLLQCCRDLTRQFYRHSLRWRRDATPEWWSGCASAMSGYSEYVLR